jgi:methionine biosynthesis protein MetW
MTRYSTQYRQITCKFYEKSYFTPMRADQKIFFDYIKPNSKVIDIGCGEGNYLQKLKNQKQIKAFGLEISAEKVASAVTKGISVIQGDGDFDLAAYPTKNEGENNKGFDYTILADSLQVMKKPKEVLENCQRISNEILVSIPNFGYYKNRMQLFFQGIMPVTKELSYEWYETPNIHFSTIRDFINLCDKIGLNIKEAHAEMIDGNVKKFNPKKCGRMNLVAQRGIFILG